MKQVLHILTKDLRRYAWAWISLAVIAVIEIYLKGSSAGHMETDFNQSVSMISSFAGGVLLFVLVVMVVQEESLADPNADWLSRPISRGSLLISKLAFIFIITLLFRLSDCIALLLNDGSSRIPYALLDTLPITVAWFAQVFLAAQTRSLPRYLLYAVAIYVGLFVLSACSMHVASGVFESFSDMGQLPGGMADHQLAWIQTIYWSCAGGAILYFLYLKRRFLRSWGLLLVAGFFALILTRKGGEGGMFATFIGAAQQDRAELVQVRIGGSMQVNGVNYLELIGMFSIDEVQEEMDLWTTIQRLNLKKDGEELEVRRRNVSQRMKKNPEGSYTASLGYVHEGQLRDGDGSLQITFMQVLVMSTQEPVGSMEFASGETHVSEGNRLAIQSFYRNDDELTLQLSATMPDFRFEPELQVSPFEAFRGKFGFSLVDSSGQWVDDFDLSGNSFMLFGSQDSGIIAVDLPPDQDVKDYRILVHTRRIQQSSSYFVTEENISVTD